jgi:Protein of unknown function (DUF1524)
MIEYKQRRMQRVITGLIVALIVGGVAAVGNLSQQKTPAAPINHPSTVNSKNLASTALAKLAIKGRAPMTGYSRQQFGGQWAPVDNCDMREYILARDMTDVKYRSSDGCTVLSGTLDDPYTGKVIHFTRGVGTSEAVQIDHVVAIGDAWQTGAQTISSSIRKQLYNDPLELLAVDGPANEQKSDGDAATWLPPNKAYRCRYVARQIAIKVKYHLWVTPSEHDAMQNILNSCPAQVLPITK